MFPLIPKLMSPLARNARLLLAVVCFSWFAVLCFFALLTPKAFVFSDETGYLLPILYGFSADNYQRWSILGRYPSYLYFWIYSFLPSSNLHASAKILNAGFIAATAIPAYAVARRYVTIPIATAFAAVVMFSPISSFVRYVMPEPMYFFGFWLVVLVVLSALDKSPLLSAIAGGALIGAFSLVKPHALALTVGVGAFFLLRGRLRINSAIAAASLFIAYYAVRVFLAYLLTGELMWSVFGLYGGVLSGFHIDVLATAYNTLGHVNAIVTLIAVPLAVTLVVVIRPRIVQARQTDNPMIRRLLDLGLLACCILVAMVAMTIYFSQSVYQINPEIERITRLHGRYYVYVLPLFMLVTIGLWQNGVDLSQLLPRRAVIILCGAMVAAAAVIFLTFEISPVDFSDLALTSHGLLFAATALFFAALILSCYGRSRVATTNLIIGATVWWAAVGLLTSVKLIVVAPFGSSFALRDPVDTAFFDPADRSGLRRLVGRGDGIVVGSPTSEIDVFRTMFNLRSLSAGRIAASGTEIRDDDFPKGARWAVVLPGVSYIGSLQVTRNGPLSIVWR